MKKIAPLGLVVPLVFASCASPAGTGEPSTSASSPIVGAAADTGDPAVVLFEADTPSGGGGDCTAEFISTTVLVSAAHCVLNDDGSPMTGATFRIYRGDNYANAGDGGWIPIAASNVHPNPAYDGTNHDISVLVLSQPLAVTPLPFNTLPLAQSDVGAAVRLVGYGSNVAGPAASGDNGGFGLKRTLTTSIDDIEAGSVHIGKTGANGCDGDSGGPALLVIGGVETLIALDSYSDAAVDCTTGDYYQRMDTEAAFVAQYLSAGTDGAGDAGTPTQDSGSSGTTGEDAGSSGSCALAGQAYAPSTCTETLQCDDGSWVARASDSSSCATGVEAGGACITDSGSVVAQNTCTSTLQCDNGVWVERSDDSAACL